MSLDWYAAELNSLRFNWGWDYLPHDGEHKDFKTGKSAKQILQKFNRRVRITPNIGVEPGIKSARMMFGRVVFNRHETEVLVECLKRYRRHINNQTNEPSSPVHDKYSHGADVFRYLSLVVDQMTNEDDDGLPATRGHHVSVPGMGY